MKKVRIKICNFKEDGEYSYGHFLLKILRKYYDVELSEQPDYIFFHESSYEHLNYNGIKIFYTGENISPNFNLCDYSIGFDYLNFDDRHYRLPLYLVAVFYNKGELEMAGEIDFKKHVLFTKQDLLNKTDFCSFVYSNYLADENRKILFDKLSQYKKVNAGGKYLNNIGDKIDNKLAFELKHKFSIAFENSSRSGYTTEKIISSFVARTIPIYWGNPAIAKEFNEKRFINCHNYENFDQVVERIIEIDNNDDLYLSIVNEPILSTGYTFEDVLAGFEIFLRNIFDQPLESAKRRTINAMKARDLEQYERVVDRYIQFKNLKRKVLASLYKPFKKILFLERVKLKYLKGK